jgi:2-phosphosulfolactate phosphatase
MQAGREVKVHLLPSLARPAELAGSLAIVVDVLRASTTIIHALASGCTSVRPVACLEEARQLAGSMRAGRVLLGGERDGLPLSDFDVGNSPREFTPEICKGTTLVFTTSNGTKALLRSTEAERVLIGGFVNFSAICEQCRLDSRPIHIVCAGTHDEPTLEDTLLAGAIMEYLSEEMDVAPNDSARLAWDCFENHGQILLAALEISRGGSRLKELGLDADIRAAADVDRFNIVPELRRDPLRIEIGAFGIVKSHWPK